VTYVLFDQENSAGTLKPFLQNLEVTNARREGPDREWTSYRIDTRFPRLRFPRLDTLLRSTRLHPAQRTGMVCVRTFVFLDPPLHLSFDSPSFFPFAFSGRKHCDP
jgi:hypothetical protein